MKRLRYSILALLAALTFVFNVERLDFDETNIVDISSFVYVLGFVATVAPLLLRRPTLTGRWTGLVCGFWAVVYLACKVLVFNSHPFLGGVHTYITVTELAVVALLSLLGSTLAEGLRDFDDMVATLTLNETSRKVRSVDEAREEIQDRILLSRRHQRPLSVLAFGLDGAGSTAALHRIAEEAIRGMTNRYVVAELAKAIVGSVRRTDLPLEKGRDGRFVVLCPETDGAGAELAAQHVRRSVRAELGIELNVGLAAFPGDALTFDELLRHAEGQLRSHEGESSERRKHETDLASAG